MNDFLRKFLESEQTVKYTERTTALSYLSLCFSMVEYASAFLLLFAQFLLTN